MYFFLRNYFRACLILLHIISVFSLFWSSQVINVISYEDVKVTEENQSAYVDLQEDINKDSPKMDLSSIIVNFEDNFDKEQYIQSLNSTLNYEEVGDKSIQVMLDNVEDNLKPIIQDKIVNSELSNRDAKQVINSLLDVSRDDISFTYQPNYQYSVQAINSNDTNRTNQWGLDNTGQNILGTVGTIDADIDFAEVYNNTNYLNTHDVIVAVIDTGVNYLHQDLLTQMWDGSSCVDHNNVVISGGCLYGYDFADNDVDPMPRAGDFYRDHGTHIAGVIGAKDNNNFGILGVYPKAKIMALRSSLTSVEIVKAISFADKNGAKVINASWGRYLSGPDTAMANAINSFSGIFVTAAGNYSTNNDGQYFFPCSLNSPNMICVGATNQFDNLSSFSNYGPNTVHIAAPGSSIYSTLASTTSNLSFSDNFQSQTPPAIGSNYNNISSTWSTVNESGNIVLKPSLNVPYLPNQSLELALSSSINMSSFNDGDISFRAKCDTEYNTSIYTDYLSVLVSGNNGGNYTEIFRVDEVILDLYKNGDIIENNHGGIVEYDLNLYIPKHLLTSQFNIKFIWISDKDSNTGDTGYGCSIDNLNIRGYNFLNNEFEYLDGTSMATPTVVGAVAHVFGIGRNPALSSSQVKNIILESADIKPSLNNLIQGSRRLNLQTADQKVFPSEFNLTTINNFATQSTSPTLSWMASTNYTNSLVYDLYLNGSLEVSDINQTQYTFPTPKSQGVYSWFVIARNELKNTRQSSSTRTFFIDSTPPNVFTPTSTINQNRAVISFSTTDSVSGINNYQISINGGDFVNATSPFTTSPLADGSYSYTVRAIDRAGNIRNVNSNFTINYRSTFLRSKADFNLDGKVNISDLSILATNWMKANNTADANFDGVTNISDLSILASNWQQNF